MITQSGLSLVTLFLLGVASVAYGACPSSHASKKCVPAYQEGDSTQTRCDGTCSTTPNCQNVGTQVCVKWKHAKCFGDGNGCEMNTTTTSMPNKEGACAIVSAGCTSPAKRCKWNLSTTSCGTSEVCVCAGL